MLNEDPSAACACNDPSQDARDNPPGLVALAYRVGTYATFSRQMLERIQPFAKGRAGPSTGALSDPAIGILDAFAITCDVLSFYQERYANEGFLRTATERRSVLELARALGYELAPGVSAQARLALLVEESTLAPEVVRVRAQTQVGSVPRQGETPVTYETSEELFARAAWNNPQPSTGKPQGIAGKSWAALQGVNLRVEAGDVLLFTAPGAAWAAAVVRSVRTDSSRGQTLVAWSLLGNSKPVASGAQVFVFRTRAAVFGHNAPDPRFVFSGDTQEDEAAVRARQARETLFEQALQRASGKRPARVGSDGEWLGFGLTEPDLELDNAYPKVQVGSSVLLVDGSNVRLSRVKAVRHLALAAFAISSKSTRVTLSSEAPKLDSFQRRTTGVYLEPEELLLGEALDASPLQGNQIRLDRRVPELPGKKALIVQGVAASRVARANGLDFEPFGAGVRKLASGEAVQILEEPKPGADGKLRFQLADAAGTIGVAVGEAADIERPTQLVGEVVSVLLCQIDADNRTLITLAAPLVRAYDRRTCRVYGNVVLATHGESVAAEVLGSGDAAQDLQRFSLRKKPLARTWSDGSAKSSLSVRVNDVEWQEVPSVFAANAQTEGYQTSTSDDASTGLVFGLHAARLPTGSENVVASYRVGSGLAGAVGPAQLSVMKAPVLGLRGVTNPLAAEGGADPESLAEARYNAPLRVTTFERIVSLQDFEDFVRALPGVAKAAASAVWSGATRVVHVTVALASGEPLAAGTDLERDLTKAVSRAGSFGQPFVLRGYVPARFALRALLVLEPRRSPELVLAGARNMLLAAFGFAARALSQPVTATEVLGLLQAFEGVSAVQLLGLERINSAGPLTAARIDGILPALPARWDPARGMLPAELLSLDEASLILLLGEP